MSSVKSRREQYSQATKAALLEAATRRFADRGFAATALEDVAADIGASRGAVYHHFASKTALFEAVAGELEGWMVRQVIEATEAAGDDPWKAAMAATDQFLQCCCDPAYGRVVWQEAPLALGWHRWKELEGVYAYGLIEQLVGGLIAAGQLPELPREPMTRITFHILGAAGMALAEAAEEDKERVKADYLTAISHLFGSARLT
ncbi:TetR/AcrR family transcriptional regulator [Nonomuraea typhae]|uniref:TetR/AcrR family transcriptional regulator n=1 Tax=Nonomuraea typhae TaxID=2603600 RepID=UPI0012FAFC12|nr:TetR family transcriptional regulator [Nonomuraea typhae]